MLAVSGNEVSHHDAEAKSRDALRGNGVPHLTLHRSEHDVERVPRQAMENGLFPQGRGVDGRVVENRRSIRRLLAQELQEIAQGP